MKHLHRILMMLMALLVISLIAGCGGGGGGGGGGGVGGTTASVTVSEGADYGGELAPDILEFVVLEFDALSNSFGMAIEEVVLQATGTADDSQILGVELWRDADGSGTFNKTLGAGEVDRLVAGPVTFDSDNGTATIVVNPFENLSKGASAKFFIRYTLSTFPTGGETYGAILQSVTANKGGESLPATVQNGPIQTGSGLPSDLVSFSETLLVQQGSLSLANISSNNNTTDIDMLHVSLFTNRIAGVMVNDFTFTVALGNGADPGGADVAANSVDLFIDTDNDGTPDGGAIATGTLGGGTITFAGVNVALVFGQTTSFLIRIDLANVVVKNGTLQFSIASSGDFALSAALPVSGVPLVGRVVTLNNTIAASLVGVAVMNDSDGAQVLDASGSVDPDGGDGVASYTYSILNPGTIPGGVTFVQDTINPAHAILTIVNIRAADYTVQCRVTVLGTDGTQATADFNVLVNVVNDTPTAVITVLGDLVIPKGDEVSLTAASSSDPDTDDTTLIYAWSLSTNPFVAGVQFKDTSLTTSVLEAPIIETVDAGFDYNIMIDLTVTDGGALFNAAGTVTVSVFNQVAELEFTTDGNRANEFQNIVSLEIRLSTDPPNPLTGIVSASITVLPSSTATVGDDFQPVVGIISFQVGANDGDTQPVTITINDDAQLEGVETVDLHLQLLSGTGALLGPRTVYRLQIQDNDDQDLMGAEVDADAIVICDPDSGFSTRRSPWNLGKFPKVTASAFNPAEDRLYCYDILTHEVMVINTITGAAAPFGAPGFENITAMTYDIVSDQLLAIDRVEQKLIRISTVTGIGIEIGSIGNFTNVQALAHDPLSDNLYASDLDSNSLLLIDKLSGLGSVIGTLGVNFSFVQGMAFDPTTSTLYGIDRITDVALTINTTTGLGTVIGTLNVGNSESLNYDAGNDLIYGTDTFKDLLFTLDRTTGAATVVGSTGLRNLRGLTWDPITETLFGIEERSQKLVVINAETGQPQPVGKVGIPNMRSLAFDFDSETMYGIDLFFDNLISINLETGIGSIVGAVGFDEIRSLTYNPDDGMLYGVDVDLDQLIQIDPVTGIGVVVGAIDVSAFNFIATVEYVDDGVNHLLYGVDTVQDVLMLINLDTNAVSTVGSTFVTNLEGMAWTEGDTPGATGIMYAADRDTDELVILDIATGLASTVNTLGRTDVRAMTYDSNQDKIYVTDIFTDVLLEVEPFSGTSSVIGLLTTGGGSMSDVEGMTFDITTNTLFAVDSNFFAPILYRVDVATGVGTNIDATPINNPGGFLWRDDDNDGFLDTGLIEEFYNFRIGGLAIDPFTNTIYGVTTFGMFFRINTTTARIIELRDLTEDGLVQPDGLAFDFESRKMFIVDSGTDRLYTIDLETLVVNEMGRTYYASIRALTVKD